MRRNDHPRRGLRSLRGNPSSSGPGVVRIKSLGEVVLEHMIKPESKSCGPDGEPCTRSTVGVLRRMHVRGTRIVYTGKEVSGKELSVEEPDGGEAVVFGEVVRVIATGVRVRLQALPSLKAFANASGASRSGRCGASRTPARCPVARCGVGWNTRWIVSTAGVGASSADRSLAPSSNCAAAPYRASRIQVGRRRSTTSHPTMRTAGALTGDVRVERKR